MRLAPSHVLMSLLLLGALGASGCAGCLSPVPPIVTPEKCPTLTTCNACVTNVACGWCGAACVAAASPDQREKPPPSCTAPWSWSIPGSPGGGTCPNQGAPPPPPPTAPPARPTARGAAPADVL